MDFSLSIFSMRSGMMVSSSSLAFSRESPSSSLIS